MFQWSETMVAGATEVLAFGDFKYLHCQPTLKVQIGRNTQFSTWSTDCGLIAGCCGAESQPYTADSAAFSYVTEIIE